MDEELKVSPYLFVDGANIESLLLHEVAGVKPEGKITLKPLLVGKKLLMLESFREKGSRDRPHTHQDHDTVCYLVKGKLKVTIGGVEHVATPGCAWYHPAGIEHSAVAMDDCIQVEIKTPPRKTWK